MIDDRCTRRASTLNHNDMGNAGTLALLPE